MKRRVLSLMITLALCLNLCPVWVLAADGEADGGLCPHHPAHTDTCGYAPPASEQECTHTHSDDCYTTETNCIHEHTAECFSEDAPGSAEAILCTHVCTEDSGCVTQTLSCPHIHNDACGYTPENPGTPCAFVCRVCPIEDLIGRLPRSLSADNSEQALAQLSEIFALYDELSDDEQQLVDLSPCASLWEQMDGMGAAVLADDSSSISNRKYILSQDESLDAPYAVSESLLIDTNGFTLSGPNSSVIQVTEKGDLSLTGTVTSKKGVGVEVQSNGSLRVTGTNTAISGTFYALDIASGAKVQLFAGTYTGRSAAIRTADGNFAALLAAGCAYFDESGNSILPADAAKVKTVVVAPCTDHLDKSYTHAPGTTTHTWTCPACQAAGSEKCTFTFDTNGKGTCVCGNSLTIAVDESSLGTLDYTDTVKPAKGIVTVTLDNGAPLQSDGYTVSYSTRANAGDTTYTVTVTVTGVAYNGTFTNSYQVDKADQPVLQWGKVSPVALDYTGNAVPESELPVTINITSNKDLHAYLQYSYKKQGDAAYTAGLPTNAGTYEVVVTLPEQPGGYQAVSSAPLTLTINKISPITTAPFALHPFYNGEPQALVSAGALHSAAARDGVELQYAAEEQGTYSANIPTGVNAGGYTVWYRTAETDNYTAVGPVAVSDVKILPKSITPKIELSESSYLYDGTKKEPKITVKDGTTVIDEDQYEVTWTDDSDPTAADVLKEAGTYTAAIKSVVTGNYAFTAEAKVEIVPATQGGLSIVGQPDRVCYGDQITTLHTIGGSGDGTVTWSISGNTKSTITSTGVLTVLDTGSITVKAERAVPNYGTVSDTWTFTVEPKPVTAEVTIAAKDYDGTTDIAVGDITAVVSGSDLVDNADNITISGLKGTYTDANAGKGKAVILDDTAVTITGADGKYAVSCPAAAKADINRRAVTVSVALTDHDLIIDNPGASPTYSYAYDGTEKTPRVTVTGTDGSYSDTLAASDYTVSYSDNKNVGEATVTVANAEGGNYTFADKTVTFEIKDIAAALTAPPQAKALTYNGGLQDLVTGGVAVGGTVVYFLPSANSNPNEAENPDSYSKTIPQGKDAGTYTVYYMVKGDANHENTTPSYVSVTINPKEITPDITLGTGNDTYVYNGTAHEPAVTVKDGAGTIDTGEYRLFYRDNVNAGTAAVIVSDANGGNYIVNGTAYFTIAKAAASFTTPPAENAGLQYNGAPQQLVTAGGSDHGTVVYSLNCGNYSAAIPTGTAVDTYTIDYKILGDANHSDTDPVRLSVTIAQNTVNNPTISLSSDTFIYNGSQQKPEIDVYDDSSRLIPKHEYTVAITNAGGSADMVDVGTYTITITAAADSNYEIKGNTTRSFRILPAGQEAISITGTQAEVRYGDVIQLGVTGGAGSGSITWKIEKDGGVSSTLTSGGLLTVKDVGGPIIVTATRSAGNNYDEISAAWEFTAAKRPVTAEVTAADRNYAAGDRAAAVTATVPASALVDGDSLTISDVTGTFDNPNVGTDKKVTVNSSGAVVSGTNFANYDITYPAAVTASILAVPAAVTAPPAAVSPLTYDASRAQALVTPGTAAGGDMVYSLNGTDFTLSIPTAKDAGSYTVYFKAQGDSNHTDSPLGSVPVTIAQQTVTPQIELSPPGARYNGSVIQPTVTLRDDGFNVIPSSEYKVTYVSDNGENWIDQNTYTVKIEDITGGNYVVQTANQPFIISATAQTPLEILNKPGLVYYGDTFSLRAEGGSSTDAVIWSSDAPATAYVDANGFVSIKGTGAATITAEKRGENYEPVKAAYSLNALPKPITAIVTAEDKVYDAKTDAVIHVSWKTGDLVGNDTIDTSLLKGTFADENAGANKTVKIEGIEDTAANATNYNITIPETVTASILKAEATVPALGKKERTYDGSTQELVSGGNANITFYSDSRDGAYFPEVPTGTNAGTYTVWYMEKGDNNHNDSAPQAIRVTISPKTLSVTASNAALSDHDLKKDGAGYYYEHDGAEKTPSVAITDGAASVPASEYTVTYSDNRNVGTATVTITDNEGGNYVVSGSISFGIRTGAAVLIDPPQPKNLIYNGFGQELVTEGTAANGTVVYSLKQDGEYTASIPVKTDAGTYQVWYKVQRIDGSYATTARAEIVTIQPQTVTPVVTLDLDSEPLTYTGSALKPPVTVKVGGTTLVEDQDYVVEYRDNIQPGTAKAEVQSVSGRNYQFSAVTKTFEIAKAKAQFISQPAAVKDLVYTGKAQKLVTAGTFLGGIAVLYSTDYTTFSASIPTGTEVDQYVVFAKVIGDSAHEDSDICVIPVEIGVNQPKNATIALTGGDSFSYTGGEIRPTFTVTDDSGNLIAANEYTVSYENNINVGSNTAKVTVTGTGEHYEFAAVKTFSIVGAGQTPLTITGQPAGDICYGDTLQLDVDGGSGTGAVTWSASGPVHNLSNGQFEVTGSGKVTITAAKAASEGYSEATASFAFDAKKKQIDATVTAANKTYDANTNAALTVSVKSGDLVSSGDIKLGDITAAGHFEDENAGEDKTVYIDLLEFSSDISAKYDIHYPDTTTASIIPVDATVDTPPTAAAGLTYNGAEQDLLGSGGTATGGTIMYSLNGGSYSANIPTAKDAGDYTVWYKAAANGTNYKDSAPQMLAAVTIAPYKGPFTVECTPDTFRYDATAKAPTVRVLDSSSRTVPESEYRVTIPSNAIEAGPYTVTVTGIGNSGNYEFTDSVEGTFKIEATSQDPLSITANEYTVHYGDTFRLNTAGGSGSGAINWSILEATAATIDRNGVVTVIGTGSFTVKAYQEASDNYNQSNTASVTFYADPKPVTPLVTAKDKTYDGNCNAELSASLQPGAVVTGDTIQLTVVGQFDTPDVGAGKQVAITSFQADGADAGKYQILWPVGTTASITKVDAAIDTLPAALDLSYTGAPQLLVSGGSTVGSIGVIKYSTAQNGAYTAGIPTGTNAGRYSVWYKVEGSANYTGIDPAEILVTIAQAKPAITKAPTASGTQGQTLRDIALIPGEATVPGTFAWTNDSIQPTDGQMCDVTFTPNDTVNYETVTFQISVAVSPASGGTGGGTSGSGGADTASNSGTNTVSAPMQTTLRNGTASTVLSEAAGSRLVKEAAANQSQNVVIKPEITSAVTKTEVSIPASTVRQLQSETSAALTVSAPIADVTIPNEALNTLASAGGTVSVVTEQTEQAVVLTLTAGGENVESVPGGVTLSVPAEDAGPGTVAVLVHEDGTRETLRKSVVEDGMVNVPLSGSATVEIVDNSKEFTDVPSTSWAADAVAFASAHELFSGTSETTFSPDQSMSRGMLASVLYSLEGQPEQELTMQDLANAFSDVSGDAWYADAVAWAAENGIANGYGDGQFGPNDSITREQLAVMLWKYAGSPEADNQALDFSDAEQASDYALKALCWAVENGILSGHGNGQLDPGGTATRAQAAQMLKNFMENT